MKMQLPIRNCIFTFNCDLDYAGNAKKAAANAKIA